MDNLQYHEEKPRKTASNKWHQRRAETWNPEVMFFSPVQSFSKPHCVAVDDFPDSPVSIINDAFRQSKLQLLCFFMRPSCCWRADLSSLQNCKEGIRQFSHEASCLCSSSLTNALQSRTLVTTGIHFTRYNASHAWNPSTQEVKAGVQGYPQLHNKFKDSLNNISPYLHL